MVDLSELLSRQKISGRELIERAHEQVSIFDVLNEFFDVSVPRSGSSFKSYCPFAFEHADGGLEKGWRTYPATNSSYCFMDEDHGYMDSVRLISKLKGITNVEAAKFLLEHYGLMRPRHWRERYNDLIVDRSERSTALGSTQFIVAALHASVRNVSSKAEFSSRVQRALEDELEQLDRLVGEKVSEEKLREWYAGARRRLIEYAEQGENDGSGR